MELVETLEIDGEEREIADAYAREQCAANAEGIDGINNNLTQLSYGENSGSGQLLNENYLRQGDSYYNDTTENRVSIDANKCFYCESGKTYTISITNNENMIAWVSIVDVNATRIISNIVNGVNSNTFTPTSSGYIQPVFAIRSGSTYSNLTPSDVKNAKVILCEGSSAIPYEPYIPSVKMLAEEVAEQNESLSAQIGNGINDVLWVEDKYINSNGVIGDASGFHYSDLIPITKTNYTYYHYSTVNTGASTRIIGYDKSGNFKSLIKEYSNTSIGFVNTTFDIPNDVYFIRISEFSNFHDRKLAPAENLQTQVTQIKNDLYEKLKVISVSLSDVMVSAMSSTTVDLPQEYIDAGYVIANILSKPDTGLSYTTGSETSIIIRNNTNSAVVFAPTTTVKVLIAKIG